MKFVALSVLSFLVLANIVVSTAAAAERKSVAVLTFSNLTGDEAHGWIGVGFAESLSAKLERLRRLRVSGRRDLNDLLKAYDISGASTEKAELVRLGRTVGVDYLLVGGVQAGGDAEAPDALLRVTARLIEVRTGRVGRAIQARGRMGELFEIQDRFAFEFIDRLGLELTENEKEALKVRETSSLPAYRFNALGVRALDRGEYRKAVDFFTEAMKRHRGIFYAVAHHNQTLAFLKGGLKRDALETNLRDAARLAPVYYNLGQAEESAGHYDKALKAYATFSRYTDNRVLNWTSSLPFGGGAPALTSTAVGLAARSADGSIIVYGPSGAPRRISSAAPDGAFGGAWRAGCVENTLVASSLLEKGQRWQAALPGPCEGAPEIEGDSVYVLLKGGQVLAYDLVSGERRWTTGGGAFDHLLACPEGLAAWGEGRRLDFIDRSQGATRWSRKLAGKPLAVQWGADSVAVVSQGSISLLSPRGGETRWTRALSGGAVSRLAFGGERLAYREGTGRITALNLENGQLAWSRKSSAGLSFPAAGRGRVYLSSEKGRIYALDEKTGKTLSVYEAGESLAAPPAVYGEEVYAVTASGRLLSLGATLGGGNPSDLDGDLGVARCLVNLGRPGEAMREYERILGEIEPGNRQAQKALRKLREHPTLTIYGSPKP